LPTVGNSLHAVHALELLQLREEACEFMPLLNSDTKDADGNEGSCHPGEEEAQLHHILPIEECLVKLEGREGEMETENDDCEKGLEESGGSPTKDRNVTLETVRTDTKKLVDDQDGL
jgi:hypothetical protein